LLTYAVVAQSKATYLRRLTLFVVSVCAASLIFILNVGFMAPAGIAGLSLAVMFSWALGSRSISVICLTTAALGLLGIGGLHAMGYVDTPLRQTSLAAPGNWYRVAVTLPSIVFIGTAGVLSLASAARANISQLITLLETLAATEQQLLAETQGVSGIDRVTARTSELESLSRMTGAVAHDVNNSLQAVTAWASTLTAREQLSPEDVREALTAIDSAVSHAEVLLAELDVDGRARKEKTVVDLAAETKRSERLLRALLSEKHTLVLEAASPAPVVTSPHAYQRALFNLVANARDAMPQPGQCRIRIDADAGVVRVVIEDEGQGMDEATRARLFDPYFTTKHTTGHGLGLFSVTALASDTSGSIRAWSEPGKGTRITLAFPRAS
jgi:signal transduction histidine kinase